MAIDLNQEREMMMGDGGEVHFVVLYSGWVSGGEVRVELSVLDII